MSLGQVLVLVIFVSFALAAMFLLWKNNSWTARVVQEGERPPRLGYRFNFFGFLAETLAAVMFGLAGGVLALGLAPDGLRKEVKRMVSSPVEAPKADQVTWEGRPDPTLEGKLVLKASPEGHKWVVKFAGMEPKITTDTEVLVPPEVYGVDLWYLRESDDVQGPALAVATR